MAIESPTLPSSLTAISAVALNPTQNNKAFFINSGLISANNTETTVISVDSVGKRDILICINPIMTSLTDDDMTKKIKRLDHKICLFNNSTQIEGENNDEMKEHWQE